MPIGQFLPRSLCGDLSRLMTFYETWEFFCLHFSCSSLAWSIYLGHTHIKFCSKDLNRCSLNISISLLNKQARLETSRQIDLRQFSETVLAGRRRNILVDFIRVEPYQGYS